MKDALGEFAQFSLEYVLHTLKRNDLPHVRECDLATSANPKMVVRDEA